MDGIDPGRPGDTNDVGDVEIGGNRFLAFSDQIAFVSLEAVKREAVFGGVDRHGPDAHFRCGAEDADGYLAAVGDEDAADLLVGACRTAISHGR